MSIPEDLAARNNPRFSEKVMASIRPALGGKTNQGVLSVLRRNGFSQSVDNGNA
jgi:hypothetical protein